MRKPSRSRSRSRTRSGFAQSGLRAGLAAAAVSVSLGVVPVADAVERPDAASARLSAALTPSDAAPASLDQAAEQVHAAGMPGMVVDAGNGDWVWHRAVGIADLGTGRKMQTSYKSRMASITKTFTATGVLKLVAEKKIVLDAPVERYLPGVLEGEQAEKITVRMLLNHTSGLGDYGRSYVGWKWAVEQTRNSHAEPEDSARIGLAQPAGPLGEFNYSNTNYILAGMIIKQVTGQDAEQYLTEHVIKPAGLKDTYFPGTSPEIRGPHSKAYAEVNGEIAGEFSVFRMRWDSTAGALISTPADLGRFFRALLGGQLLPAAELAEMKRTVPTPGAPPEARGYGLGIAAYEVPGCGLIWFHNGGNPGVDTWAGVSDDGRRHFAYSLNLSGYGMPDRQGHPRPNPIGDALEKLKEEATRQALCPGTAAS